MTAYSGFIPTKAEYSIRSNHAYRELKVTGAETN